MIAAGVLGVVALVALYLAFGRSMFGSSTAAKPSASPTPSPRTTASSTTRSEVVMPSQGEQDFTYQTTAVVYSGAPSAPDPGRNIFAFYEPPPPCVPGKTCPTPTPAPPVIPTPSPVPTPPIQASFVNPQAVYAGQRGFRLEVNGNQIPPDARIYFNQTEMPTTYVNGQRVVTDIPANLIAQEGPRQIILQTPDGKKYSNPLMLTVQAPPRPTFTYIGMIGRKRYNNDTAYFIETEKSTPFGARLNDVVGGRFRLVDIAPNEVTFEDVSLGFKHRVPITKAAITGGTGGAPAKGGGGFDQPPGIIQSPYDQPTVQKDIPGIPNNIPRYVPPPQAQPQPQNEKKDVDDNDNY